VSYKRKNIILGIVFVLICAFAYQFSIKKTFNYKKQFEDIQGSLEQEKLIKQNILQLTQHKAYLDSLVKIHKITTTNLQNELLTSLNSFCETHDCEIASFEEPHVDSIGNIENTYNRFSLRGNYKQLINTIYELEYGKNLGQLVSVSFETKKDYKRNNIYLTADILIKNTQ